jgi:transposase
MTTPPAPRRDFAALQQRRRRAARWFAAGKRTQAEMARELHVSRQSVSRWVEAWRSDEPGWIGGAGRAGRRPKLDDEQLALVDEALRQGARVHGFGTELWTLPRVATLIERITGVRYHRGHVWKVLGAMQWSLQRVAKQARERNQEARRQWGAEQWPAVKKTPGVEKLGSSSRTKAASRSGRR